MAGYFDLCLMILASFPCWSTNVAAKSVCYEDVGCFDTELPCNLHILPQSPSEINTRFYLFTPENPSTYEVIDWTDDASIVNSNFQGNRDTKFIIHGFISNIMEQKFQDMKDAFLSIGNFNVILVNWKNGADLVDLTGLLGNLLNLPLGYEQARQNTRLVGRQIGVLSRKLQRLTGASFTSMHLIGHSLGAHLAGFAGEYLSGQYGRISGLDPAGPGFDIFADLPGCLLEKSDAIFVDIIHTDGVLGNGRALGDQDFYPSGGVHQVSCDLLDHECDHSRAVSFFTESITSKCTWLAYPCSSWIYFMAGLCKSCGKEGCSRMGYYADRSKATGSFMLNTNKEKPYCREDSGQPKNYLFLF
ncbi:Pancreatic triacylglycerol lipase [Holothuria leucospilota]|uniref:Pancreatic triacylglycerol lipase n=1 Tax=Holothuria leucospilota TaxID=206669 RepID=A0A9Q0YSR0_HOLLE|nr:Pancreatic triacylglycerol lipase [Holothuria leucospilota]